MKVSFLSPIAIGMITVLNFSCEKSSSNSVDDKPKAYVGFDNVEVRYLPIRIIIDGNEVGVIGNPMRVYQDCGNRYVHAKFKVEPGAHTFALIQSLGYYADGTFNAAANNCLYIPMYTSN